MRPNIAITICLMGLIVWSSLAVHGSASEENKMGNKGNSAENGSKQSLPCNWEGWSKAYPEVDCGRMPCDRHDQVLKMKCTAGTVEEVKLETVCVACTEFSAP